MARKKLFTPGSTDPFELSRTKLELFVDCPRCFWLDRVKGISRPSGPPFTLNKAVDELLVIKVSGERNVKSEDPGISVAM